MKIQLARQKVNHNNISNAQYTIQNKTITNSNDTQLDQIQSYLPPIFSLDTPTIQNKEKNAFTSIGNQASKIAENTFSKSGLLLHNSTSTPIQKRDIETVNYNDIAKDIHDAIDGLGTDEEKVYHALAKLRRNPVSIEKLKEVYKDKYKVSLMSDIKGDFSGSELAHVKALLATGESAKSRTAKTIDYTALAEQIHGAIKGAGTDEEGVYAALLQLNNNPTLIKKLKAEYKSKYGTELYTDLIDDFKGSERAYVLELLKDKTKSEQVNVDSEKEAKEAKKIIKEIKEKYGIDVNSKAGVDAIKKDYTNVPTKVLDQLTTTAWEFKELVALKAALDHFAPILGDKRKDSNRKAAGQEVTNVSKVDQAIDSNAATGVLDNTTLGEYFEDSTNFSLFTAGTNSTVDFSDNEKQLEGTTVHEIAHGLLEYALPDFVSKMDYWLDKNTKSGTSGAEKPITKYGETNAGEDFSEAVMFYFVKAKELKKKCPKRHAFIKKVIKDWKK